MRNSIYCESCGVAQVRHQGEYCDGCIEDILKDLWQEDNHRVQQQYEWEYQRQFDLGQN